MTQKNFKTLFKPLSMNVHQQFFMSILMRHQWESLYLWSFTDLIYLLEQEEENVDPETLVKELLVANPIILNTLRTTIKQETKKQYNKNLNPTYSNRIFPLATKTELRQGGRKQSVQTLIKLIHSVEKYYDEHNGQRKEAKANTIKEDPKKWTWQLYQELNQALMHPTATYQRLFYQNYASLENRTLYKKQHKDYHIDQNDVIKQLEILLLPAIEKTRQGQETTQIKRSSKLKGNLQGHFKASSPVDFGTYTQLRRILLKTSSVKNNSIEKHRLMKSNLVHSRLIRKLLKEPENRQMLTEMSFNPVYQWEENKAYVKKLRNMSFKRLDEVHNKNLIYSESLQKDFSHFNQSIQQTAEHSVKQSLLKSIIHRVTSVQGTEQIKVLKTFLHKELKRSQSQTLIYEENRQKELKDTHRTKQTSIVEPSTLSQETLDSRLRMIIKQTSLLSHETQRKYLDQSVRKAMTREFAQTTRMKSVLSAEQRSELSLEKRHAQTLIYQENRQKEFKDTHRVIQTSILEQATLNQANVENRLKVSQSTLEDRLKMILKRTSLLSRETQRKYLDQSVRKVMTREFAQTTRMKSVLSAEQRSELSLEKRHAQTLIYQENRQKEFKDTHRATQTSILEQATLNQANAENLLKVSQSTVENRLKINQETAENRLKMILKRTSLLSRETQRKYLGQSDRKAMTREFAHTTRLKTVLSAEQRSELSLEKRHAQNLIYQENRQKELKDTHRATQTSILEQATLNQATAENRLKMILKRTSLLSRETQRRYLGQSVRRAMTREFAQTTRMKSVLSAEQRSELNLEKRHAQNLIYQENRQKELKDTHRATQTSILEQATLNQATAENRLKMILKRTSLLSRETQRKYLDQSVRKAMTLENRQTISRRHQLSQLDTFLQLNDLKIQNLRPHHLVNMTVLEPSMGYMTRQESIPKVLSKSDLITIKGLRSVLLSDVKAVTTVSNVVDKGSSTVTNNFSEQEFMEIETLRKKLAIAKETERLKEAHEKLLITSTRKLLVRNKKETELRHHRDVIKEQSLRAAVDEGHWQHKVLSTKRVPIEHHDIPPLIQAVSKEVDRVWIKELIKETEIQKSKGDQLEKALNTVPTAEVSPQNVKDRRQNETEGTFEVDALKIDLIADQVFRRVTDKIERERKRRGM